MENLNLLFYKTFYSELGKPGFETDISKKSKRLVSSVFLKNNYNPIDERIAPDKFQLKTAYPGLLAGTGYAHGVDSEEDIKVGFSFDFVTGQPYIPGSSVKGLLKSYFKHEEVVCAFLGGKLTSTEIKELQYAVFESEEDADVETDVFFDAVVRRGDENGKVMGYDSITPHGKDLTKNPNPIKIIKIMPDVILEFSFDLKETKLQSGSIISAEDKKKLFISILCHFGIGAKTNVGYGVLTDVSEMKEEDYIYPEKDSQPQQHRNIIREEQRRNTAPRDNQSGLLEKGKVYDCTVTGGNDYCVYIRIDGMYVRDCYMRRDALGKMNAPEIKDGDKIRAEYTYDNDKGRHCFDFKGRR